MKVKALILIVALLAYAKNEEVGFNKARETPTALETSVDFSTQPAMAETTLTNVVSEQNVQQELASLSSRLLETAGTLKSKREQPQAEEEKAFGVQKMAEKQVTDYDELRILRKRDKKKAEKEPEK